LEPDGLPPEPIFGYSELNIMAELYMLSGEYLKPIEIIKRWCRTLQCRWHEKFWDDYEDDREFDVDEDEEEEQEKLGNRRKRGLPLDLRIKLGQCRIMSDQATEGKVTLLCKK